MKKTVQTKVEPTTYEWLLAAAKTAKRTVSAFIAIILDREKEKDGK